MTTSQRTVVESALKSDAPLPKGVLVWTSSRVRNSFFDYVHAKLREAEVGGMTRKELAERIGKSPTRLSHILSNPGNWTLDTVSELLIGISKEEVLPSSRPILGHPLRNERQEDGFNSNRQKPEPSESSTRNVVLKLKFEPNELKYEDEHEAA